MMTETRKQQIVNLILRDIPVLVGVYRVTVDGEEPFFWEFAGNYGPGTHCSIFAMTLTFEVGDEEVEGVPSGTEFQVKMRAAS